MSVADAVSLAIAGASMVIALIAAVLTAKATRYARDSTASAKDGRCSSRGSCGGTSNHRALVALSMTVHQFRDYSRALARINPMAVADDGCLNDVLRMDRYRFQATPARGCCRSTWRVCRENRAALDNHPNIALPALGELIDDAQAERDRIALAIDQLVPGGP
jgi:hypothetical protein